MQRGSMNVLPLEEDYDFNETDMFFETAIPSSTSSSANMRTTGRTGGFRTGPAPKRCFAHPGFAIETRAEDEVYICRRADLPYGQWLKTGAVYPAQGNAE
jgi:tRNA (mo5U34)-methyltransferase